MKSIKNKLVLSNAIVLIIAFILVGTIFVLNMKRLSSDMMEINADRSEAIKVGLKESSDENIQKITKYYQDAMLQKGKALLNKDRKVLERHLENSEYSDIRAFLNNAFRTDSLLLQVNVIEVKKDKVISYYLADRKYPDGLGFAEYNESYSEWQVKTDKEKVVDDTRLRNLLLAGKMVVEKIKYNSPLDGKAVSAYDCFVPVVKEDEVKVKKRVNDGDNIAFYRIILSLGQMEEAIAAEKEAFIEKLKLLESKESESSQKALQAGNDGISNSLTNLMITAIFVLGIGIFIAALFGGKISGPILKLKDSAEKISKGDYSSGVHVESSDEVGVLGKVFENMRMQVKEFTEKLQEMVDDKTREISDILNAIDQGIFTINLDMTVNEEHSKKQKIFSRKISLAVRILINSSVGAKLVEMNLPSGCC